MDDLFSSKETQEQDPGLTLEPAVPEDPVTPVDDPEPSSEAQENQSVPLIPGVSLNKPTSYPPILGIPQETGPTVIDPETFKYEKSLSTAGYLLVLIAMQIPVAGLIMTIVFACSAKRKSLRNLSRAMIIIWLIMLALSVGVYFFVSTHTVLVNYWISTFQDFFRFLK